MQRHGLEATQSQTGQVERWKMCSFLCFYLITRVCLRLIAILKCFSYFLTRRCWHGDWKVTGMEVLLEHSVTLCYSWRVRSPAKENLPCASFSRTPRAALSRVHPALGDISEQGQPHFWELILVRTSVKYQNGQRILLTSQRCFLHTFFPLCSWKY